MALTLAGCAVGPNYKTPKTALPQHWDATGANARATTTAAPQLEHWWQRLDDPTLDQLMTEAVKGNLDVASAVAKIREARAAYRQAGGALEPSVNGVASATRAKTSGGVSNAFQAGFDASWELDLFGGNHRSVEAAGYNLEAKQEQLRDTLLTMVGDVATYYVEARGYQARIALAKRTAAAQRETAELTHKKFAAGGASAVDVAEADAQADSTDASLQSLEYSYAGTLHRLSILLGLQPGALKERLEQPAPVPVPPLPMPAGVPAEVLLARPDVRMAERQLAQYTAEVGVAEAARYPSISLSGSIATSASQIGELRRRTSIGWSFGPSINLPIFNAGQLAAGVDIAKAQRDQYYIAFRSTVLSALEDVDNAVVALSREQARNAKLVAVVAAYRKAVKLADLRYRAGSTSFLELLDAQRSLYSAEDTLAQSNVALTTDYIALNKALGGGWNGKTDTSSSLADTD